MVVKLHPHLPLGQDDIPRISYDNSRTGRATRKSGTAAAAAAAAAAADYDRCVKRDSTRNRGKRIRESCNLAVQ